MAETDQSAVVVLEPVAWRWRWADDRDAERWDYREVPLDAGIPADKVVVQPLYAAAPKPTLSGEREAVRSSIRNADPSDWDYLSDLLLKSVRHEHDAQTKFWLAVMSDIRAALSSPLPGEPG